MTFLKILLIYILGLGFVPVYEVQKPKDVINPHTFTEQQLHPSVKTIEIVYVK